ncbi:MAG TPA: RNA polymerase sigma factor [Tepidisphaeraceae bacterium]|nr:RNA polymerase sigma factor [Tepidisphaeraceae bacterium]
MDAKAKQLDSVAAGAGLGSERDGAPTDEQLVSKCMAGDRRSFDELIKRYQRQAVAVSYRLLGNSHDALEVTQDAFLKAYSSIKTLQKPGAFGGWLMRIVSNLSLNYRRSRKLRSQLPLDDCLGPTESSAREMGASEWMAKDDDPVHRLESEEMGAKLKEALNQLPEKQRLAIIMFTIEQMPQKQVAESLECSVEAVKWHVFQGRKKLKEILKDYL